MTRSAALACRECGVHAAEGWPAAYCGECFGPLDVVLGPPVVTGEDLRARIAGGGRSMWRYADLLPIAEPPGAAAVGWTPLVAAPTLGARLGVPDLWLKDETANPTGSFKDRAVAAALGRALAEGRTTVAAGSTGNLGRALVRGAATAGLRAVVLVPEGVSRGEPGVIEVRGDYDAVNRLATEAAMAYDDWGWVNVGLRPWYVEGCRPVAHEIAEQCGWIAPQHIVAPMASGALVAMVHRAFADMAALGLVTGPAPAIWAAQPAGCAPVAAAFAADVSTVRPVRPDTTVGSLAMGDPPDGDEVLRVARTSAGGVEAVPEERAAALVADVAECEGIAVELAGGVALGAVARLAEAGRFLPGDRVVAVLTGAPLPVAPSGDADRTGSIEPSLAALTEVLRA